MTNVVLVTVDGGMVQDTINLHGETDVIVLDWDTIDRSGNASTEEAILQIAEYKIALAPWREQVPEAWAALLQNEQEWLEGVESDARLTYPEVK